ncbi:MAG: FG-GAP-like repeat-containing protein [Luteimonas sp.]
MRIYLTAAILLGLLAGCSSDQASSNNKATASANSTLQKWAALPTMAGSRIESFASLPDRGELLSYEQGVKVKHAGAYTAYPVSLSEAHALNAMRTGEMVVKAPNGELLHLKYESHVEHPDGNWSWIGRNADGASAVLTFGEKAVFGTIPQGVSDTLRLTVSAGQSWLVQTDRSKLSGLDGAARRDGTDQLIPPKLAASGMVSASMRAQPTVASAAAAATAVVDVLLGYTNGLTAQLGGQSQVNTRLNNLIVITNQAYVNSGVNMRVRLVKTLAVSYPDNNDNGDTLEKLTGYKSGSGGGPTTPDPAFNALRAARDASGADLVSLVRPFRTPENNGCGIAWLIGGAQSGIEQSDAPFGYSVVSDGTDLDEGDQKTYFCREETLAHELGHNMGQAHNDEDSDSTGVHPYSYGYRESSSSGFYTVMAYPQADGSQFSIPYFANPSVKYNNRVTGVANASDNVRSMNQTMPIIASFRATVFPLAGIRHNDVDADGISDLLFHNAVTRQFSYRVMNGPAVTRSNLINGVGPGYSVVATGDFNGDGRVDIVWTSAARDIYMWLGNGTNFVSTKVGTYPAGWTIVGAGDVDGDAKSDLLFHNATTRQFSYRIMNGKTTVRSALIGPVGPGYTVATIGDFNGDGKVDVIWTSAARDIYMWVGNGTKFTSSLVGTYPSGWRLVSGEYADINGDGNSDLLFHNATSRQFSYRVMKGTATISSELIAPVGAGYTVATTGDFNGDGKTDIVWSSANSDIYMWLGNGKTFNSTLAGTYPSGWKLIR